MSSHLRRGEVLVGQQRLAQLHAGAQVVVAPVHLRLDALMSVHQQLHRRHVSGRTHKHTLTDRRQFARLVSALVMHLRFERFSLV